MKQSTFTSALISAVMAFIMSVPIIGMPLVRQGVHYRFDTNFKWVGLSCLAVFTAQLLRPWLASLFKRGSAAAPTGIPAKVITNGWVIALVLAVAAAWPFFAGRGSIDIATLTLIYIMLGLGLNIVVGFAGLLDLGFVGFYAVGAYTYALLYHWCGLTFWQALPLSGAMSALFGFLLGFPVLRLRGDYLAIVTLGFGEIIRLLLINMVDITGGPDGISGIPKPTVLGYELARYAHDGGQTFTELIGLEYKSIYMVIFLYLMALVLAAVALLVSNRLLRMPIGRAWEALREDEIACRSLGINPVRIKLFAFTLGAMFAGFGGAFFATRQGMVNPESFTFIESALILSIVVLGGMGSQLGVIMAAILIIVLPELARGFSEYRMLMFGVVMVLMMLWRPQGLLPMQRPKLELSS